MMHVCIQEHNLRLASAAADKCLPDIHTFLLPFHSCVISVYKHKSTLKPKGNSRRAVNNILYVGIIEDSKVNE